MANSPQEKPKKRKRTPKYERERWKRHNEELSRLLEIPLTEQTEEEKRKLAKMQDQRKRKRERERQWYHNLSEEKKKEINKQKLQACRRKAEERRIQEENGIDPGPKRRRTFTDAQKKRNAEGYRKRRLEDEKILNSELAEVSEEQIQRALLVLHRKEMDKEKNRQRYHNLSEEEKREIYKLRTYKQLEKIRKEEEIPEAHRDELIRIQKDRRNAADRARRRRVREEKHRASGSLNGEVEMDAGIGRATGLGSLETPVELRRSRRHNGASMETSVGDEQTAGLGPEVKEKSIESHRQRYHNLVEEGDLWVANRIRGSSNSDADANDFHVDDDVAVDSDADDNDVEDSDDDDSDTDNDDAEDSDADDSDDDEDFVPTRKA